jgi:tRNA (cmo5U34)-methyltransferase
MIDLARSAAEAHGLADRIAFVHGTLDDLPVDTRFDAATLCFVLMHMPDNGAKLNLLHTTADRLKPTAPLILIDAVRDQRARFAGAWRSYALDRGATPDALDAFFERITTRGNAVTEARNLELLAEAGFHDVTRFFTALTMSGWLAKH